MACCGKTMCAGCIHAVQSRAVLAGRVKEDNICPFCRTPNPKSNEEIIERFEKRMDMNDARAIFNLGGSYSKGLYGLPQNYAKALGLWRRAAELGYANAIYNIGLAYRNGCGVEKDKKMAIYYYELAAIGGYACARTNLGVIEWEAGNYDRTIKHYILAAREGESNSLKNMKSMYMGGQASKDDYAKALRGYQSYLDEIKSDQREEAAVVHGKRYY